MAEIFDFNKDKTTYRAVAKYNSLVKKKAEEYGVSEEEARKYITTEEMRNVIKLKAEDADLVYMKARLNSSMNPVQRQFIEELATVRHILHSHIKDVFFDDKILNMVTDYIFRIESNSVVNELGIDVPVDLLKSVSLLHTYKQWDGGNFKDYTDLFIDEAETFNKNFEDFLARIDKQFGSSYTPKGYKRKNHSREDTQSAIYRMYNQEHRLVAPNMCAKRYVDKIRAQVNGIFDAWGYNVHPKISFKGFSHDSSHPDKIALFVEAPQDMDYKDFEKALYSMNYICNGIRPEFDIVTDNNMAIRDTVNSIDFSKEMPYNDRFDEDQTPLANRYNKSYISL